ncbi:MAG: beta-propeller fold lactonase family protein [Alphaproteobacteria bacterium]|nr:beta-propeller fold lactonase family protein [Alphaproteobacteria bacterium]
MLENGQVRIVQNPPADIITILDLGSGRVLGQVAAPHSVVGPPTSVAISTDGRLGLVASAQRIDAAQPTRTIADNRVSVIDLAATPPAVVQTVEAGAGASGLSINAAGTLALVANRNAGSVSVFRIQNGRLSLVSTVGLGTEASGPSHAQFTPDGRYALVTRDGDSMVSVLRVDGEHVRLANRDITAGIRPYGLGITRDGRWALVANIGRGTGDADTVSLIAITGESFRMVDTVSVGATPEGIQVSPDNRHVAVTVMNGSNRPAAHPLFGRGQLVVLRIDDGRLVRVAQADVGTWGQGVVFNADGTRIFMQNMVEREIQVLAFDGTRITDTGTRIAVQGGPSAIRAQGQ